MRFSIFMATVPEWTHRVWPSAFRLTDTGLPMTGKPLEILAVSELGVDIAPRLTTLSVTEPAQREAGVMVGSVAELVEKLRGEAKVI